MNFLLPHMRRMPSGHRPRRVRRRRSPEARHRLRHDAPGAQAGRSPEAPERPPRIAPNPPVRTSASSSAHSPKPRRSQRACWRIKQLKGHPEWYQGLPSGDLIRTLLERPADATDDLLDARARPPHPEPCWPKSFLRSEFRRRATTNSSPLNPWKSSSQALRALEKRHLDARLRELRLAIADAERRNDEPALGLALQEQLRISRTLRELEAKAS